MAAPRSPNYPRISLKEAIDGVRKIWNKDGKARITLEAALAHLGYKSNNGAAQATVSALRKFGLLSVEDGKLAVSNTAIDILEGQDNNPEIYRAAIQKAAFLPPLFQELRRDFPDSIPSPEAVRFHLVRKKFSPDGAAQAAATYRETMELVTAAGAAYNSDGTPGDSANSSQSSDAEFGVPVIQLPQVEERPHMPQGQPNPPPPAQAKPSPALPPAQAGYKQDVFSLAEGDVILRWPESLSRESFPDFDEWLAVVVKKIRRAVGAEPKSDEQK